MLGILEGKGGRKECPAEGHNKPANRGMLNEPVRLIRRDRRDVQRTHMNLLQERNHCHHSTGRVQCHSPKFSCPVCCPRMKPEKKRHVCCTQWKVFAQKGEGVVGSWEVKKVHGIQCLCHQSWHGWQARMHAVNALYNRNGNAFMPPPAIQNASRKLSCPEHGGIHISTTFKQQAPQSEE